MQIYISSYFVIQLIRKWYETADLLFVVLKIFKADC
uniref:Uncharacterized protein n=1 Tax=Anguilla anguilla TaxID=7936 RepID=A0A0E9QEL7_ANGAN